MEVLGELRGGYGVVGFGGRVHLEMGKWNCFCMSCGDKMGKRGCLVCGGLVDVVIRGNDE